MTPQIMIVIFEDGTVDICKLKPKDGFIEIWPLAENAVIINDFKIACNSNDELLEEIRAEYPHIEYATIKQWKSHEELLYD
jgi:hypothetical protein